MKTTQLVSFAAVVAALLHPAVVHAEEAAADAAGEGEAPAEEPPLSPEEEALLAEEEARAAADAGAKPVPKGKGAVVGTVTDTKFNEPLIEAPVSVVGTKLRALTDLDGRFRIELPPGRYTLRILYDMHQPARLEGVVVVAGQVTRVDAALNPDDTAAVETLDVEVEVDRTSVEGQTLARRKSASVGDGVGRAEIARSPDRNAAEAAQRVVGASVVGGRFVYVRGLGERYTNAQLNGAPLPSPEPDRATVPLDLFPALVLDSITVNKTFTPDVPGDFAGGSVRIATRELPRQLLLQASLGVGFNTQSTFAQRLTYRGSSTDWLGFDGGTRALPSGLPSGSASSPTAPDGAPVTVEQRTAWARSLNSYMSAQQRMALPNGTASVVVGDSFKVGQGKLGVIGSLNYSRTFIKRQGYRLRTFVPTTSARGFGLLSDYEGEVDTDQVRWGGFASVSYEPVKHHRLSVGYFHSQSGDSEVRALDGVLTATEEQIRYTRLGYTSRALDFVQVRGEHELPAADGAELGWSFTTSRAQRNEPDARETSYRRLDDGSAYAFAGGVQGGSHFWSEQREVGYTGALDYTQPLGGKNSPTKLKLGGLGSTKSRSFEARRFYFETSGRVPLDTYTCAGAWQLSCPDRLFLPDNIGAANNSPLRLIENTRLSDRYDAGLDVYAGYLMADTAVTDTVRVIVGQRLEITRQQIRTTDDSSGTVRPLEQKLSGTDLLPAASVVWSATPKANLRFAASRTLARPQVRELAPFGFTSSVGVFEIQGNPGLELTHIDNYDTRFEFFPTGREVLAVSLFHKRFTKPIEEIVKPASNGTVISYANADAASLIGLELEGRKTLGFLTPALSDFALVSNVTFARSRIELSGDAARVATNTTRPLSYQSPFIVNVALDWEHDPLGLRARLLYNVSGARIVTVGTNGLPDIYEQPRHNLDLTAAKTFGKQLELKLTATNLLLAVFRTTQGDGVEGDEGNVVERWRIGQTYTLTGTYTF